MFSVKNHFNKWVHNRLYSAFSTNSYSPLSQFYYNWEKPQWTSLRCPEDLEHAVRFNPIVKATIGLIATAASNGKKALKDTRSGEIIPWDKNDKAVQKAHQLFVRRPNPLQSAKEFAYQGIFYLKTFGNRYVYANMPIGFNKTLDLMNISTLYNLPSQFIDVRATGKIYNQTELSGIISNYALKNRNPIGLYTPNEIIHFNEVNVSSEMPSIMGIPKLEALEMPVTNTQKAFEAMNTLLTHRGMQGILTSRASDGVGTIPLSSNEEEKLKDKFKKDYGLLDGQNPFLISPVPLDYFKTVMNSSELGIYEEFSNNAIIINNEFNVPPELGKTYIKNATYENQIQSVRRLYEDNAIPMTEDQDSYLSDRLDTYKYGFEITSTWDHIPALAESFKDKAQALNLNGRTAKDAYNENIITWNQYLDLLGLPQVPDGDVLKKDRKIEVNEPQNNNDGTEE